MIAEILPQELFSATRIHLERQNIEIEYINDLKPWGGYFIIKESSRENFFKHFFSELDLETICKGDISPKILLIAPKQRLSWQYHKRRSEYWKLIAGDAYTSRSDSDSENVYEPMNILECIEIKKGERHRIIGGKEGGIIAEIWCHSDLDNPSDEHDYVRVLDDYGR